METKNMETKKVTKVVYIANDGKEFLTEEECKKHETFVEKTISRIKYFCVRCHPDLTETGNYMHKIYVAVFSEHYFFKFRKYSNNVIKKAKEFDNSMIITILMSPNKRYSTL